MTKRMAAVFGTLTIAALAGWFVMRAVPVSAANPDWLTDMQKAQKIAEKENKDLLINFTGSDWCSWCIKLKEEVFSKEGFEKAHQNFVFVEMDFPQNQDIIPPKTRKQNEKWSDRFGIEGFPTIVLTDENGRPYGSLGYVPGGPEAFLAELEKTQKSREVRDEKLAKAKQANGLEKAKLLASALDSVPAKYHLPMYRDEVDQIIALDEKNQIGLKSRFEKIVQRAEAEKQLETLQQEIQSAFSQGGAEAALKLVQKELKAEKTQANPILKQQIERIELQLFLKKAGDLLGEKKIQEAKSVFETVLEKTEKGTNDWLMVQVTRADLLSQADRAEQAAAVYDEIMTLKSLNPAQKAMLLVYAAEAHDQAKQAEEKADRMAQADKLLTSLKNEGGFPPQLLEQLSARLENLRQDDESDESPKDDGGKPE